jgi:hypothetical protein
VKFHPSCFFVKDRISGKILHQGPSRHGLYHWFSPTTTPPSIFSSSRTTFVDWHAHLSHPVNCIVHIVLSKFQLPFTSNKKQTICPACQRDKSHQLPFSLPETKASVPLELIFSAVWEPSLILSNNGARFYVIFVDHFSKFTWLYPIACKSDAFSIFPKFQAYVERQFNHKIKSIQTDGGIEYTKLRHHFASHGIHHRITCPHTHQQNGSIEHKHRHIVEMVLTLLAHCSAPLQYWAEAFLTTCYLINRLPTLVLNNASPFQIFFLPNLIIASCMFLDVLVGLTSGLTANINSIFTPKLTSSLATVPLTVATNAYISLLVASTFFATSSLTNPLFLSISPHHLLPPILPTPTPLFILPT